MRLLTALLIGSCLTATGALAQSTGSYVMSDASLPKSSQQSEGNLPPGHGWLEIIKRPTPEAFAAAFTKDVVLDASVLPRSITGATVHAAHNPAQYEQLARRLTDQPKGLELHGHMVSRADQRSELGTDAYFGGVVFERHASVNPARFHQGILDRALDAGTRVFPHCAATNIRPEGNTFRVECTRGSITARNVIVATNGYTNAAMPWLQRRVIPIGSYIIATEPIPRETMARLMPKDRVISDTRKVVYYYRASPDGQRILFGGRVSHNETDPRVSGPRLHAELTRLFPELATVRVSHSWMGFVAYTFDELMRAGVHDGIHYAMGYCGSGVGMAGYLGMRVGQQVLGLKEGATAFDTIPFDSRPYLMAIRGSSRRRSCTIAGATVAVTDVPRVASARAMQCRCQMQ